MVDLLNAIQTIGQLVIKIKDAVKQAKQNAEECRKIEALVVTVGKIVNDGQNITEELTDTLMLLATALDKAWRLISKCRKQDNSIVTRAYNAGDKSNDLQRAERDISTRMHALHLAISVQNSKLLKSFREDMRDTIKQFIVDFATTQRQQVQAEESVQTLRIRDDSTYVATRSSDNKSTRKNTESDAASRSREKEDRNQVLSSPAKRLAYLVKKAGLQRYSLSELSGPAGSKCEIGDGGTGTVYKQKIGKEEVAVKMFTQLEFRPDELLIQLDHEIYHHYYPRLEHENIIELLGCCYPDEGSDNNDENFYLVSRYMPNGSLASIIDGSNEKKIDLASLVRIIQGIAEGVRYLHQKRVIHLDLKPSRILFDSKMTPKIIDFQTARMLDSDVDEINNISRLPCSMGYMAPELHKERIASTKSDVFSFGVILLEALLCICKKPQNVVPAGDLSTEWINRVQQNDWTNVFDETRVTGDYELTVARSFLLVAFSCCEHIPANRPSMPDVVKLLEVGSLITGGTNNTDKEGCSITSDGRSEAKGKGKEKVSTNRGASSSTPLRVTDKDYIGGVVNSSSRSKSTLSYRHDDHEKRGYKIFTKDQLRTRIEEEKRSIAKDLALENQTGVGEALLRHFKWTPGTVLEEWRSNHEAVCNDVGLQWNDDKPVTMMLRSTLEVCQRCKSAALAGEKRSAGCDHYCCDSCWLDIISENVERMASHYFTHRGAPCLSSFLKCWSPTCKAPIVQNLVDQVASVNVKDIYVTYLLRSYVDDSDGRRKWCPNQCGRAIEIVQQDDDDNKWNLSRMVVCDCYYAFRGTFLKEPHKAVSTKCSDMV